MCMPEHPPFQKKTNNNNSMHTVKLAVCLTCDSVIRSFVTTFFLIIYRSRVFENKPYSKVFWGPEELFTKYSYVSNYVDKDIWTVYSNSCMNCIKKIIVFFTVSAPKQQPRIDRGAWRMYFYL